MARPTLYTHRKFLRLSRILGTKYKAAGVLDLLWSAAYQTGHPLIGDWLDVETVCDWDGPEGDLAEALEKTGFVDCDQSGMLWVHDLADHCPDYVLNRFAKEQQRLGRGYIPRTEIRDIINSMYQDDPRTILGRSQDSPPEPSKEPVQPIKKTTAQEGRGANVTQRHAEVTPKSQPSRRFTPPTLEEVEAFITESKLKVDARSFIDFYESKGWMVGKNKMKDWRAACRRAKEWESNQRRFKPGAERSSEEEERMKKDLEAYAARAKTTMKELAAKRAAEKGDGQ